MFYKNLSFEIFYNYTLDRVNAFLHFPELDYHLSNAQVHRFYHHLLVHGCHTYVFKICVN